ACFALNGVSFVFVVGAVLALRGVPVPRTPDENLIAQLRAGLHVVQRSPALLTVMGVGFAGAVLGVPLFTFLPLIARAVLHGDAGCYTRLMTFAGAGAIAGALVVAWLGNHEQMGRQLLVSLMLFGAVVAGLGLSRRSDLFALMLVAGGGLFVMSASLATTL